MLDDRFFDDAQRHDLEAGHRLQLGEVGQRELAAVDRRLVALIEERRDGHAAELRERIVDDRLVADVRQDQWQPGSAGKHHASEHGSEKKPAVSSKPRNIGWIANAIPAPLLAKRSAHRHAARYRYRRMGVRGLRESVAARH